MKEASRLACLALALLLPAASAAAAEWPVEASTARLDVERGSFQADLALLVLEQVVQTQPMAAGNFELIGRSLHLEIDRSDSALVIPGATVIKTPTNTTVQDFQTFASHGTERRSSYQFIVRPAPSARITVEDSCSQFASSTQDAVTRNPRVASLEERGAIQVDTHEAAQWTNCSRETRVTVTGDFLLALWQCDFLLEADGRTEFYQTGRLQPQALEAAPDSTAAASRFQQAFLTVQGGSLSFQLASGVPHEVYLKRGAQVSSADGASLVDAAGTLRTKAGLQPFQARRLEVQGNVEARLTDAGTGKPLQAALGGELESVEVDGATVLLAVTATPQAPWPWLLGAVGAVGLLAAPLLARPLLRRRGNRRSVRIHELTDRCLDRLNRLHFEEAEVVAAKLADLDPTNPEAHYLLACAIARRENPDPARALMHHEKAHQLLQERDEPMLLADNACQAARCTAALHDLAQANQREEWRGVTLEWMRQAVAANPKVMADLTLHRELQTFVGELVIWCGVTADDPPDWLQP